MVLWSSRNQLIKPSQSHPYICTIGGRTRGGGGGVKRWTYICTVSAHQKQPGMTTKVYIRANWLLRNNTWNLFVWNRSAATYFFWIYLYCTRNPLIIHLPAIFILHLGWPSLDHTGVVSLPLCLRLPLSTVRESSRFCSR